MKVKCKIVKTVYAKEDYRVFGCVLTVPNDNIKLNKYGSFTITGSYSFLDEYQEYELDVEEGESNKYGTSYIVKGVPSMLAEELTDENEYTYLLKITSSDKIANAIHSAYPDFIRKILKGEEEEIDIKKIYNVGKRRLATYIAQINTKFKYFHLMAHFPQYKLSIEDAKELSNAFTDLDKAKEYIERNPYSALIEYCGRGFERTDKMIIEHDDNYVMSEQRAEFMLLWLLDRNEMDGSTRIYANDLAGHIREYDGRLLPIVKTTAVNSSRIYFDEKSKDMAIMATYLGECQIANFIKEKLDLSNPLQVEHGYENFIEIDGFKLSEKQQQLLKNALEYKFSILLGYSGSGKSSSVLGLIKMLEANKLTYTLLCPTGKASKRLRECTGRKTTTIHRAIGGGNEITTDYVIVDEFSMCDVSLTVSLFKAITNINTRVILVGDNAQLSSIGAGNVFNDMIESKIIPIAFLDEVFRYSENGMLKVATDIRNGKSYFESNESVQHYGKNFTFIQADNKTAFDILMEQYKIALKKHKPSEIMVLSPFNVGDCGTYNINNMIQAEVNPPKPKEIVMSRKIGQIEIVFRVGSFVLNTKNDYKALTLEEYNRLENLNNKIGLGFIDDEDMEDEPLEPQYKTVYNGDTGIVRSIDEKKMVVQIDEELIVYEKNKLNQLLLSYSISTHKSQGSQAEYVINLSLPMHNRMLTRNMLYVADTRSSKTMIEIGDINTIKEATKIADQNDRNTFLGELLLNQERDAQFPLHDKGCEDIAM